MASYLMVPADKLKFLEKIESLQADFFIVNLEDGVYDKAKALQMVVEFFKNKDNKKIIFRVNSICNGGLEEIKKLNILKPYAIRVSKIKTKQDVDIVLKLLHKDINLHLSLETKEAFSNIGSLKVSSKVTTLYLGILDLLHSLGLSQELLTFNNPTIEYILTKFLVDARSVGFEAVSFVYQEYKNIEIFTKWCNFEKQLGFNSKVAISPSQLEIINQVFKVNSNTIKKAKYIVDIFEQNQAKGICGFSDEKYGFIDEPIYKNAKMIVSKMEII